MELRDVVETLVSLDDDLRAITNEVNRALDGLERAVMPPDRFGVSRADLEALRERLVMGVQESAALQSIVTAIRGKLVGLAQAHADRVAAATPTHRAEASEALAQDLGSAIDLARSAFENVGRLKHLMARRADSEAALARARRNVEHDEETQELLGLALSARQAAAERSSQDARRFLVDADAAAAQDGTLAGIAANVRALRDALRTAQDAGQVGGDLVRRVVDASLKLAQEREELKRRLAQLAHEAERRQEITHGLFQAVTKASEVLELAAQLSARLEVEGALPDGALGPLRAACLEHGIVSLLLDLRGARIEREALERSASETSAALGAVLTRLADDSHQVERIGRAWDVLAEVDATAVEQGWEAAFCTVLGVEVEGGGVLRIPRERLERLSAADSLEPWSASILEQLETSARKIARTLRRLDSVDAALESLAAGEGPAVEPAGAARARLAEFRAEARRATETYWTELGRRLLASEAGLARVTKDLRAFRHVQDLAPGAAPSERRAAVAATLEEVRATFTELESGALPGDDGEGIDWRKQEEDARNRTIGAQRSLAVALSRAKRLRELVLPPPPEPVPAAIGLAAQLRAGDMPPGLEQPLLRDRIGEALESLHLEKHYLEHLALPPGSEVKALASLSRERSRRLLDLHGASLSLLFRLLEVLGVEYETLPRDERPGHLSWIEELLAHGREEMGRAVHRLEECLFDLDDNSERLGRWTSAFDAYRSWAQGLADTEAGHEIVTRRGLAVFEGFEAPLGRLGDDTLRHLDVETPDWRQTSALESLMELLASIATHLEGQPTASDLRGAVEAVRARAAELRDRLLAAATAADEALSGPSGLF